MTMRSLMAATLGAIFCLGALAVSDGAYAKARPHKAAASNCRPMVAGPICPPFQSATCGPGCPVGQCSWSACRPWGSK